MLTIATSHPSLAVPDIPTTISFQYVFKAGKRKPKVFFFLFFFFVCLFAV
jgi:hypothetical protein